MTPADLLGWFFRTPRMTRGRVGVALAVALFVDGLQLALGPLGWVFVDEGLDILGMIATCGLLGFHPLLLPTVVVEFIPVVDLLPTWTGCVVAVVILRKRQERGAPVIVDVTPIVPPPEPTNPPTPPRLADKPPSTGSGLGS